MNNFEDMPGGLLELIMNLEIGYIIYLYKILMLQSLKHDPHLRRKHKHKRKHKELMR